MKRLKESRSPYKTDTGVPADKSGVPIHAYPKSGLARIQALPAPLTSEELLKAVSGHACGLLNLPKERLASLRLLGEAYRLWGARSEGVRPHRAPPAQGLQVQDVPTDTDTT